MSRLGIWEGILGSSVLTILARIVSLFMVLVVYCLLVYLFYYYYLFIFIFFPQESSVNKLLYNREVTRYRGQVESYYQGIADMERIETSDLQREFDKTCQVSSQRNLVPK